MKSEVSQLPLRRGLIQLPILSADVSRRSSVCFRPRNVGMLEQVMSPCAHVQLRACRVMDGVCQRIVYLRLVVFRICFCGELI